MAIAAAPGSRTIERALSVLDAFTGEERQWRTTRLAERCGLPIATTHRIVHVFESYGYLTRDQRSGAYALGPAAAGLACDEEPPLEALRAAALPGLRTLARATGSRVSASALARSRDYRLEVVALTGETDARGRSGSALGPAVLALHAGASSKALLAQLGAEELDVLLGRRLERVGPRTITMPEQLRRQVAATRRRGWAFSCEETAARRWAVAVPVPCPGGEACALAASAPLTELEPKVARQRVLGLMLAARSLRRRLAAEATEHRGEPQAA
jgi:DNA-binding IclR family transcriptional regulator